MLDRNFNLINVPINSTNSITIIGETTPYISSFNGNNQMVQPGAKISLTGSRLSKIVLIDGIVANLCGTNVCTLTKDGSSLLFTLPVTVGYGWHSLQIRNSKSGDSNVIWFEVKQADQPPHIATSSLPTQIAVGQSTTFYWSASDPDNTPLYWNVNWGDGTDQMGNCPQEEMGSGNGWSLSTNHIYNAQGNYKITTSVYECGGNLSDQATYNVRVSSSTSPNPNSIIVGLDASNPPTKINYVDVYNGTQAPIPMLSFNVTGADISAINQISVNLRTTQGTPPTGVHLFQGNTELAYQPIGTSSNVNFYNLHPSSSQGNIFNLRADLGANTPNGTMVTAYLNFVGGTSIVGSGCTSSFLLPPPCWPGNPQFFYHATPQMAFQSADYAKNNDSTGVTKSVQMNFHFTMTPYPGQAVVPQVGDFTILASSQNSSAITEITNKSISIIPSPSTGYLAANQTYNITLSGVMTNPSSGTYNVWLNRVSSSVQDANGSYVNIVQGTSTGLSNFNVGPIIVVSSTATSSSSAKVMTSSNPPVTSSTTTTTITQTPTTITTTPITNPFAPTTVPRTTTIRTATTTRTLSGVQANVLNALESLLHQAGTTSDLNSLVSAVDFAWGNLVKVFGY